MLSTALATTFAAVSSSGVLVIDGSRADSAGRKADAAIPARLTRIRTTATGASVAIPTAASPSVSARSRSEVTMIRRRGIRSASAPANGAANAAGASRRNAARPTSPAPPSA